MTTLQLSVDEAVKCLSQCLLTAAQCIVKNVVQGPDKVCGLTVNAKH